MKTATYHQPEGEGNRSFAILADHGDGTVDLGHEAGKPVVTRCRVTSEREIGSCTLDQSGAEEKPAKGDKPAK